ncbi:MAG TPA: GtrA family protein [Usitatibacter sp.]|jgi:putative flippase GtrA
MKDELRKFFIYCVVGFISTGTHYAVMISLIKWGGTPELIATCVGYVSGSLVKYPLNHGWVFASQELHREAVPKFVLGGLIGFFLNAAVFAALLTVLESHYMVAQVITTGIVLFANYLLARYWIFFTRSSGKEAP